jgi:hypothetical protein
MKVKPIEPKKLDVRLDDIESSVTKLLKLFRSIKRYNEKVALKKDVLIIEDAERTNRSVKWLSINGKRREKESFIGYG